MNGGQDLGGMMGFGPVNAEIDEPFFHADWERKILALTLAMGATGSWNIDTSRHARESIDPGLYLTLSYYQIWIEGLERLLVQSGLVEPEEIETGKLITPPVAVKQILKNENVEKTLATGGPSSRPTQSDAIFKIGDFVDTLNINPKGHSRLARYLRARRGEIIHVHGTHVFPDASAHGKGDCPQWLYTVRFSAVELWGSEAIAGDFVHADLWEPYLKPAARPVLEQ